MPTAGETEPDDSSPAEAARPGCAPHRPGDLPVRDESADAAEPSDLGRHRPASDAVCFDGVSYTYPKSDLRWGGSARRPAVLDLTLHVRRGCRLGVIGPNGAGKSTMLKIMLGQLSGYAGRVEVMGLSPKQACRRGDVIGYVPQRHEVEWRMPVNVEQVVMMGLSGKLGLFRRPRASDRSRARRLMERVDVRDLADQPIGDLSGGQQQRAFLARALVAEPQVLVLDEPMAGLDERAQKRLADLLTQLHRDMDLTVIVVSHDLKAIAAGCDQVACLNQRIHYHAAPEGLTREVLGEVFEHDIAGWPLAQQFETG